MLSLGNESLLLQVTLRSARAVIPTLPLHQQPPSRYLKILTDIALQPPPLAVTPTPFFPESNGTIFCSTSNVPLTQPGLNGTGSQGPNRSCGLVLARHSATPSRNSTIVVCVGSRRHVCPSAPSRSQPSSCRSSSSRDVIPLRDFATILRFGLLQMSARYSGA